MADNQQLTQQLLACIALLDADENVGEHCAELLASLDLANDPIKLALLVHRAAGVAATSQKASPGTGSSLDSAKALCQRTASSRSACCSTGWCPGWYSWQGLDVKGL